MPLPTDTIMTPEDMTRLLTDIDKLLPERLAPYEISMLVSFICHRYRVPTSSGVHIFAHVLDFLDTQYNGPRSEFEIN